MLPSSLRSLFVAAVVPAVLVAASTTVACRAGDPGSAPEPAALSMDADPGVCPAGTLTYTFSNYCYFTVWVGQHSPTQAVVPKGGSWELPTGSWLTICAPEDWSGTFWGRTGCSRSGTTLDCATGQCGSPGMLSCGAGDNGGTPMSPISRFEVTTITRPTAPTRVAKYDLSLATGYNVPMFIEAVSESGDCGGANCLAFLNARCPPALQHTVPKVSTQTRMPCGDGFCPEGFCVGGGTGTCVAGCLDPCTQCERNPSTPGLDCDGQVDDLTYTGCDGNTYRVTNQDLYCAKNTQAADGHAMASPNQGTPTCDGLRDCPFGTYCMGGFSTEFQPPAASGACIDLANRAYSGHGVTCGADNVGAACGGYLEDYATRDALGYTCQALTLQDGSMAYPCLPPLTRGMGTCTAPDPGKTAPSLYSAVGGLFNQAWVDAGTTAGGGTTPYYDTFHLACPRAIAWQYDDVAGSFECNDVSSFSVSFCF